MPSKIILDSLGFKLTINRLAYQLIENHGDFSDSALLGLQPHGIFLAGRIHNQLLDILGKKSILIGAIDVTFSRDDFRRRESPILPNPTQMDFVVEGKKIILIDDVLYTGRTVRAGLDEILAYGRPAKVELLVLIDRRFTRHLPIEPNYTGKSIDTIISEKVKVEWEETDGKDKVILRKS